MDDIFKSVIVEATGISADHPLAVVLAVMVAAAVLAVLLAVRVAAINT